jgi:hypothetical protein
MADDRELIEPDWPAPRNVRAVATTRLGGVSIGTYRSLNLADHVGDDPASVAENRRRLARSLDLPAEPHWLQQVHGTTVRDADAHSGGAADAMIASAPGEVCVVLTADCLPVLLCDDSGLHVGAVHAGWRGLAAGVIEATILAFMRKGVAAEKLLAWIGPSIGPRAYEVGDDVRDAFLARDPAAAAGFAENARGRWQLDMPLIARRRLAAAGVTRVWGGDLCTHGDPRRFFSYRRDGTCGRQATLIWLAR